MSSDDTQVVSIDVDQSGHWVVAGTPQWVRVVRDGNTRTRGPSKTPASSDVWFAGAIEGLLESVN